MRCCLRRPARLTACAAPHPHPQLPPPTPSRRCPRHRRPRRGRQPSVPGAGCRGQLGGSDRRGGQRGNSASPRTFARAPTTLRPSSRARRPTHLHPSSTLTSGSTRSKRPPPPPPLPPTAPSFPGSAAGRSGARRRGRGPPARPPRRGAWRRAPRRGGPADGAWWRGWRRRWLVLRGCDQGGGRARVWVSWTRERRGGCFRRGRRGGRGGGEEGEEGPLSPSFSAQHDHRTSSSLQPFNPVFEIRCPIKPIDKNPIEHF